MILVKNIQYKYDSDFIIENISFDLGKSETLAIVGPSGSGKTTILKLLLGAFIPDSGSITINNLDITNIPINKRNLGYCPQDQLLFPHLNVFENIAIGLRGKNISKNEIIKRVESLAKMGGISSLLHRKPSQLSGGQKQRVSILRALATRPSVLLFDEPFHNLDSQIKNQIVTYIKKIQTLTNVAVILVTHDITEARILADKLLILENGKMLQVGSSNDLSYSPINYQVAKTIGLPNVFKVLNNRVTDDNRTIVTVSFGDLLVNTKQEVALDAVIIDPTLICINKSDNVSSDTFHGVIKSNFIDFLSQKQIYTVQLTNEHNQINEYEDLDGIIQVAVNPAEKTLEMNKQVNITIETTGIKLLYNNWVN